MPRQPRSVSPGGYYHVVSRGNNRQQIFDDALRREFPFRLDLAARRCGWLVVGWALMPNHYHLVLQVGDAGLSAGMRELNTGLAVASNARFGRINHCLGGRFWCTELTTERHLFASIRYALWNPARAGFGAHPADSGWTSYRASAGLDHQPRVLALGHLLGHFGPTPARARHAFRRFVDEGAARCRQPWDGGRGILR
jgi:REP element-mobilizing transposase RayT